MLCCVMLFVVTLFFSDSEFVMLQCVMNLL